MSAKIRDAFGLALAGVTAEFVKEKHRAAARKSDELSPYQIERLRKQIERDKLKDILKKAAYAVMEQAYLLASDNGRLPANARQIMYAARPLVMEKTGGKCWSDSAYFTQTLLPDYIAEHAEQTADWDVVYDARGHLVEPHVRNQLGLGTLEVRSYVKSWREGLDDNIDVDFGDLCPTKGPANRYRFALFIEKEGFDALLERSQIAKRYDLAIFSSKGMSTTATRMLVENLSNAGVTILVAHDFDLAGLTIVYTLAHDTRRYTFRTRANVIDIGLRLADVQAMNLQHEPVEYKQKRDPRQKFQEWDKYYDTTGDELNFLVDKKEWCGGRYIWRGKRVELNAMTSGQFISWLERKLEENSVEKVVPDEETLRAAWLRAKRMAKIRKAIEAIEAEVEEEADDVPKNLKKYVRKLLENHPTLSWDQALALIAVDQER